MALDGVLGRRILDFSLRLRKVGFCSGARSIAVLLVFDKDFELSHKILDFS